MKRKGKRQNMQRDRLWASPPFTEKQRKSEEGTNKCPRNIHNLLTGIKIAYTKKERSIENIMKKNMTHLLYKPRRSLDEDGKGEQQPRYSEKAVNGRQEQVKRRTREQKRHQNLDLRSEHIKERVVGEASGRWKREIHRLYDTSDQKRAHSIVDGKTKRGGEDPRGADVEPETFES